MNVRYEPGFKGVAVPDPWCTEVPPTPDELKLYFRFVQKNVLEYSNDRVPLSKSDYLAFAWFLSTHGLSASTVTSIIGQLVAERTGSGNRWKRAVLLDKLQLDLFRWYFRKTNARFATFFLNSHGPFPAQLLAQHGARRLRRKARGGGAGRVRISCPLRIPANGQRLGSIDAFRRARHDPDLLDGLEPATVSQVPNPPAVLTSTGRETSPTWAASRASPHDSHRRRS